MSIEFIFRIIGMIVLGFAGGYWGFEISKFTPDDALRTTLVFGLVGALVGAVCAVLSCYLVLKGWSLMGDAISHAVLPAAQIQYGEPLAEILTEFREDFGWDYMKDLPLEKFPALYKPGRNRDDFGTLWYVEWAGICGIPVQWPDHRHGALRRFARDGKTAGGRPGQSRHRRGRGGIMDNAERLEHERTARLLGLTAEQAGDYKDPMTRLIAAPLLAHARRCGARLTPAQESVAKEVERACSTRF